MKALKYISNRILAILILSSTLVACSEDVMDRVNRDNDNTKDAPAKFLLADVITRTAFYNASGDFNTYLSSYVEHEVGTHNQLYRAEHRQGEPAGSTTFNNTWGHVYRSLKDARIIIEKCSEGGSQSGNEVTLGIGQVMAAYNSALIADMFGDAPWTQAAVRNADGTPAYMTPEVDKQETIYKGIMDYLDQAIINLQGTDSHSTGAPGEYDLLYNGNKAAWLKMAYGLKARYTMRLINRSANVEADMNKVLEYLDKSFTSVGEQAAFAIYDATNLNPLFDFQWSRDGLAASESMGEKLLERNDPRFRRVFVDAGWEQITGADDENYFPAPNGRNEQLQYYYNTSIFVLSQTAPTLLLSYHEVLFLRAEALCRLGRTAEAEEVLKEAIIVAIENTERSVDAAVSAPTILTYGGVQETTDAITAEEAAEYFEQQVKPLFSANPLKETMNQKYIAFFGASGESTECYNDIRRLKALGEDWITLKNPNRFPLRCPYGADDTTTNPNVKELFGDGSYVYTENVWWAGGNR